MTTSTQPLAASMLTAPIAAIDRRALSQAWYSALHLRSRGSRPGDVAAAAPRSASRSRAAGVFAPPLPATAPRNGAGASAPRTKAEGAPAAVVPERRAPRSALARRIESAFLNPRACLRRATFSLGDSAGSRVHVTLQSAGGRVRLVALCAPAVRDRVARALAQARYALADRGIEIEQAQIGDVPC